MARFVLVLLGVFLVVTCRDGGAKAPASLPPTTSAAGASSPTPTSAAPAPAAPTPTDTPESRIPAARGGLSLERSFGAMGPIGGPYHPPDPVLAVGPDTIVVATNHGIELRDKRGRLIDQTDLRTFFSPARQAREGQADPRVVYDPWSERFFVHAHGGNFEPCQIGQCVFHNFLGVSRTSSPRSLAPVEWRLYAFDATLDGSTPTDHQIDYVRLGVAEDVVTLVSVHPRAVRPGEETGDAFTRIRILDKGALLDGSATTWKDVSRFADPITGIAEHVLMQPAIQYDRTDVVFFVSVTPGADRCDLVVWGLSDALSTPRLTHVRVSSPRPPAAQCPRPPDAAQPDGIPALDIAHGPVISAPAVYRAGSLWVTYHFAMNFGSSPVAAVRVVELDVSRWPRSVSVDQDVVLGEDGLWTFMPAIAVDQGGDVAIVFARSGVSEYPSAYYSGRLASDPPNTFRPAEILKAGTAPQSVGPGSGSSGGYRWGDYSTAAIDPTDETAWIIGEYTETTRFWGTWIGHLDWK